MDIYNEDGTLLVSVTPTDNSYRYRAIKGLNEVRLTFSSPVHVDLPLGCYVMQDDGPYTLESPAVIKKNSTRDFEYQCTFSGLQERLKRYRFRNNVDGRLKFSLTAKPHEHLAMLVANLNQREDGWTVGSSVDAVETVISYNFNTCLEALDMMADTFETEWEIVGKTIHLKRVEYFKDDPLPLSYGKGNGFVSGVGRSNRTDEDSGLEILYAIGGTRNVYPEQNNGGQDDTVKGTDTELILPRAQEYVYEGHTYRTDDRGYYLYDKNRKFTNRKEGALDCSEIYPNRVGTISEVIVVDAQKNLYDFKDSSIPEDLDYSECLLEGEKMTVVFQDGMLAGKEFEANYKHEERRFELVAQDVDNVMMPNDTFKPVAGGKYAVFNVKLPKSYVCDNAAKEGASWDMFRKAAKYLHDHADYFFGFTGTLDKIWAKRNWESIKGRLVLGGTVLFSDPQFQPDGTDLRITGIKDYLNNPEAPELELSNESTVGQSFAGQIGKLETLPVTIVEGDSSQRRYTRRTFQDAKETMQALNDALEAFMGEFTEGISPITINTMQLLVGSEQCQFEFVSKTSGSVINHEERYNEGARTFYCAEGRVRFQVGNELHAEAANWQYRDLAAYTSGTLDGTKIYYVYARCRKASTGSSVFANSTTPLSYDDGLYYNLLVGILDKEQFGSRSWCPLYGFTEISPGRIRVNKIISTDGNTYFDLQNNEIGGTIRFLDGLISGLIGVAPPGSSASKINAGLNGEGNTADTVRIWAGAPSAQKESAPFRVLQDGTVVMEKTFIRGNSSIEGFLFNKTVTLTSGNLDEYCDKSDVGGVYLYYPNLSKIGGNIVVDSSVDPLLLSFAGTNAFPFYNMYGDSNYISLQEALQYVGKIFFIKNNTPHTLAISGPFMLQGYPYTNPYSPVRGIPSTQTIVLKCFLAPEYKTDSQGYTGRYVIGWGLISCFGRNGEEYTLAYPGNWGGIDAFAPRKS